MDPSSDPPETRVFAKDPITGRSRLSSDTPEADAISARPLGERQPRLVEVVRIVPNDADPEKDLPKLSPLGSNDAATEAGLTEFVVYADEADTGKPWPLFIVPAADRETVYGLCQRRYLTISAVEPYEPAPDEVKPPVCPWGPPASDHKFEREYHHRKPEQETQRGSMSGNSPMVVAIVLVIILVRVLFALLR